MGDYGRENGFRDFSRSRVAHLFLRGGWQGPEKPSSGSLRPRPQQAPRQRSVPESLLDEDRGRVFTQPTSPSPISTSSRCISASRSSPACGLDATGFFRSLGIRQFNADAAEEEDEVGAEPADDDGGLPGVINRNASTSGDLAERCKARTCSMRRSRTISRSDSTARGGDADVRLARQPGVITGQRGVDATGDPDLATDVSTRGSSIGHLRHRHP